MNTLTKLHAAIKALESRQADADRDYLAFSGEKRGYDYEDPECVALRFVRTVGVKTLEYFAVDGRTELETLSQTCLNLMENLPSETADDLEAEDGYLGAFDAETIYEALQDVDASARYEIRRAAEIREEEEKIARFGALYEIQYSYVAADPISTGDQNLDARLRHCYRDFATLGRFHSDAEAIAMAEGLQRGDDRRAELIGIAARGEDFELTGGPSYLDCIYKQQANGGFIRVEV